MKMPGFERAYIEQDKILGYLLSNTHPVGYLKARFFNRLGFDCHSADRFSLALLEIAQTNEVFKVVTGEFGIKYIIHGTLITPLNMPVTIVTVWICEKPNADPRLITTYPL